MDADQRPFPPDLVVPPGMVARWDGDELIVEAEPGLTDCGHSLTTRCSDCGRPRPAEAPPPSPFAVDPALIAQVIAAVEKTRVPHVAGGA